MGVAVRIRRNVSMWPVYDIPMQQIADIDEFQQLAKLTPEVKDWLAGQGLPDDPYGNLFTWFESWVDRRVSFFFVDRKLAMLFKLTWA